MAQPPEGKKHLLPVGACVLVFLSPSSCVAVQIERFYYEQAKKPRERLRSLPRARCYPAWVASRLITLLDPIRRVPEARYRLAVLGTAIGAPQRIRPPLSGLLHYTYLSDPLPTWSWLRSHALQPAGTPSRSHFASIVRHSRASIGLGSCNHSQLRGTTSEEPPEADIPPLRPPAHH